MWKVLSDFARDERGATAIEYALIASGISMSIVAGASGIGTNLVTIFDNVKNGFN